MLGNGLGEAIGGSISVANRVFDLFTGSAAVAWHIAERYEKQVIAGDLQLYSTTLAAAVIKRAYEIKKFEWVDEWFAQADILLEKSGFRTALECHQSSLAAVDAADAASTARALLLDPSEFPISSAYAGYYFSPWQAAWLDSLRVCLPAEADLENIALASLIQAASRCAASPGHTAQPFKPNETAGPYLLEAWRRDLPALVRANVTHLSARKAKIAGAAYCMDALKLAEQVNEQDLAFVDPPYSGVHYSRFYHVLESIARGKAGTVSGTGRYPPAEERPSSDFSMSSKSRKAFDSLLSVLSGRGANVIITFPAGKASNGLAGDDVKEIAATHFSIQEEKVSTRFSTLGGDMKHRAARHDTHELILKLSAI